MNLDKETTCLLLIDIQKDYQDVSHFPEFRQNIRKCLKWARKEKIKICHVFEVDNHHSHWIRVWEEMSGKRKLDKGKPFPFSKPHQNEKTIIKHGYDAFFETPLHEYLQKNNIKSLYVCGLLTGVCVLNSVFSAFNHGYHVSIIENCCSDRTKDRHQRTLKNYKDYLFRVVKI